MLKAHRVAYTEFVGSIPENMCVCHSCDNPTCVNPEHLWLGTHSDNMNDMWSKTRHPRNNPKQAAKLTKEDVLEIRKLYGTLSGGAVSKMFGVNSQSIYNIWNGYTWKDI